MMKFAVVGSPISHSLSPVLHSAVFQSFGLDWTYQAIEVKQGELRSLLEREDLAGLSVTMPLKPEAFHVATGHDFYATETGVVNTLVRQESGYFGVNTDVRGFQSVLDRAGLDRLDRVVIVGNGATATSALASVRDRTREVLIMARRKVEVARADGYLEWGSALEADLVISTVPSDATSALPPSQGVLFDVIYSPWPTPLAARWPGSTISGLELLIHQAAHQSRLFLAQAPVEVRGEFELEAILATMRQALPGHRLSN